MSDSKKEIIGFIGIGNMGEPMAANLLKAGYALKVYNRTPEKVKPLVSLGAIQVEKPEDVAEPGGIVITMVSDDPAIYEIIEKTHLLEKLSEGGIHLSMSTLSPSVSQELAQGHKKQGVDYLTAPVFGRPEAAAVAKLWICISGNAQAKERVQPILKVLSQGIYDFGEDPGAANVIKLAGNFMIASAIEAMSEAFTLAEKNGISREKAMEFYSQTLFACPVYQNYGKLVAQEKFQPTGFRLALGYKDIHLVKQAAERSKVPMPFASLLHDRLLSGLAKGREDWDWSSIAQLVSEDAGL